MFFFVESKSRQVDFIANSKCAILILYLQIDVTVYLDGVHGDCSKTFLVGEVDDDGKRLVSVTEECLKVTIYQFEKD